jgi:hypothetical protein
MLDICEAPKPVAYTKGLQYVLAQNVGHLWGTKPVAYTKGLQYVLAQNVGQYKRTPICMSLAQDVGHLWDQSKDHNFRACFASLILCHVVGIFLSYVSGLGVLFRHISGFFIRCNKMPSAGSTCTLQMWIVCGKKGLSYALEQGPLRVSTQENRCKYINIYGKVSKMYTNI